MTIIVQWKPKLNLELLILAETCTHKPQNVQTLNAIKSNNLTCLNCKSPDHLVKDCPEPNKMQQVQSNKRQNNSIESAIEAPTQTLKSLLNIQKSHGYSKPKQPFHHKRAKPHGRPSFKPTYRPITIKENTAKTIANIIKSKLPIPMQLKIMKPCI